MENYFEIGKVIGARGLKGELRVYPLTDDPERFKLLDEVWIDAGGETRAAALERARVHQGIVLLKLAGIDDIDRAEKLKGAVIKIPPEKALPLEDNEYYVRDLIGLEVVTVEGENLGKITDVLRTGANDVYVVNGKLMIPAIKDCVRSVDVPGGTVTVSLLEGLRDL